MRRRLPSARIAAFAADHDTPSPYRDAGDGEVVEDETLKSPGQTSAGDLRPSECRLRDVLPPNMPAPGALVAAHADYQYCGSVPEWFVCEPTGHGISERPLAPTLPTLSIRLNDPALDHRTIRSQVLTDGLKAEFVEAAERGETGRSEGSVEHVEVFQVGSERTSIFRETSAPTLRSTRSDDYTLDR